MPEFYMIITRQIFFRFLGDVSLASPVSCAYDVFDAFEEQSLRISPRSDLKRGLWNRSTRASTQTSDSVFTVRPNFLGHYMSWMILYSGGVLDSFKLCVNQQSFVKNSVIELASTHTQHWDPHFHMSACLVTALHRHPTSYCNAERGDSHAAILPVFCIARKSYPINHFQRLTCKLAINRTVKLWNGFITFCVSIWHIVQFLIDYSRLALSTKSCMAIGQFMHI